MEDAEINAMITMSEALIRLEVPARQRVLNWTVNRFGLDSTSPSSLDRLVGKEDLSKGKNCHRRDVHFEHLADLFQATNPKTDADRALVAAYWFQNIGYKPHFTSAQINSELKHLGHAIPNITYALSVSQEKKPAMVIQLRKNGSTRQAQKVFKLTNEGVRLVESMLQ